MPQKGKLPIEEKIKVVEEYLSGSKSIVECARRYGISEATVISWVRLYKMRGIEGLTPATQTRKYSEEIKKHAVEDYLSGRESLKDLCIKYDISGHGMLQKWIKRYNNHEDFRQPNNGGVINMAKGRKTTLEERIEIVGYCIANNKDYGKAIERYDVSYQQVYGWVRRYAKDEVEGLIDRRGKQKDEASMSEIDKLRARLKLKEAENQRLQMENELLKKLEALERGRGMD